MTIEELLGIALNHDLNSCVRHTCIVILDCRNCIVCLCVQETLFSIGSYDFNEKILLCFNNSVLSYQTLPVLS